MRCPNKSLASVSRVARCVQPGSSSISHGSALPSETKGSRLWEDVFRVLLPGKQMVMKIIVTATIDHVFWDAAGYP